MLLSSDGHRWSVHQRSHVHHRLRRWNDFHHRHRYCGERSPGRHHRCNCHATRHSWEQGAIRPEIHSSERYGSRPDSCSSASSGSGSRRGNSRHRTAHARSAASYPTAGAKTIPLPHLPSRNRLSRSRETSSCLAPYDSSNFHCRCRALGKHSPHREKSGSAMAA